MSLLLLLITGIYALYFVILTIKWLSIPEFKQTKPSITSDITVIIPARNESQNIKTCLESILEQDFPFEKLEVIVVDDHSTDNTFENALEYKSAFLEKGAEFLVVKAPVGEGRGGKKSAINVGIKQAKGSWIVTTDADTRHQSKWLITIASFIDEKEPVMVCGPVAMERPENLFGRWQMIEFSGLTGTGGASLEAGMPNMCNGANLAYRKDAYKAVNGFKGFEKLASGDDEFLMHKMNSKYPGKVRFLKSRNAIVYTRPGKTFKEFFQQRIRWASKGKQYKNLWSTSIATLTWSVHFMLILLVAGWLLSETPRLSFLLILLILKTGPEFLFLSIVLYFYSQFKHGYLYWLSQPFYWIYISLSGFAGISGNYSWKGRTIKEGQITSSD